jgi:hypothetical protein
MFARSLPAVLFALLCGSIGRTLAEEPTAREVAFHSYTKTVELKLGKTRAVLCPQAGGRVLEFSVDGSDAMWLEEAEVCHWGRSFSPGGGICVVPLGDRPSRFPGKYTMYEDGAVINVRARDENIRERDGFLEILAPPRKPKLGFDTYAGWLAYIMPNDRVFVKRFPTFPERVYNEAAGLTLSV